MSIEINKRHFLKLQRRYWKRFKSIQIKRLADEENRLSSKTSMNTRIKIKILQLHFQAVSKEPKNYPIERHKFNMLQKSLSKILHQVLTTQKSSPLVWLRWAIVPYHPKLIKVGIKTQKYNNRYPSSKTLKPRCLFDKQLKISAVEFLMIQTLMIYLSPRASTQKKRMSFLSYQEGQEEYLITHSGQTKRVIDMKMTITHRVQAPKKSKLKHGVWNWVSLIFGKFMRINRGIETHSRL